MPRSNNRAHSLRRTERQRHWNETLVILATGPNDKAVRFVRARRINVPIRYMKPEPGWQAFATPEHLEIDRFIREGVRRRNE
jgi:hypothetical protein